MHLKDGLKLTDAYINAVVRCAPPENKPTKREIQNCECFLEDELKALKNLQVIVALGKIACDAYWRLMATRGVIPKPKPRFAHVLVFDDTKGLGPTLVASYHPSQQNTNTRKLTAVMMTNIFQQVRTMLK